MSDQIPFVAELGERLAAATRTAMAPRRRRRRRWVMAGVVAVAAASGAGAAVHLMGDGERAATIGVACQVGDATTVVSAGTGSPVDACRTVLAETGQPVPPQLVACERPGMAVFVVPGGSGECERRGWRPLSTAYTATRERIVALGDAVMPLERGCPTLAELTPRVQAILDRQGWTGWTAAPRPDLGGRGPCATVTMAGGGTERTIEGAIDPDARRVNVTLQPHPDTLAALGPVDDEVVRASSAACRDADALEAVARAAVTRRGLPFAGVRTGSPTPGMAFADGRQARYDAGCTVGSIGIGPDGRSLELVVSRRS